MFNDELRRRADELRTRAGDSVWAAGHAAARGTSEPLEAHLKEFNEVVTKALPDLY